MAERREGTFGKGTTLIPDQAIGAYEAGCLLGVHWTTVARMVNKGLLTSRQMESPTLGEPERVVAIYSLAECEADYAAYAEQLKRGGSGKSPRYSVHKRPEMVNAIAAIENPIAFGDAISSGEAGKILGVHWSFPPRLVSQGKIIGRNLINLRNRRSRHWMFSRASCEVNAATMRRLQAAGRKKGRDRKYASGDPAVEYPDLYRRQEGWIRVKNNHKFKERNPQIVKEKKRRVYAQKGALPCEACGFDFFVQYGERGRLFAEGHHRDPFAKAPEGNEVTPEDFAIVCANCHRMLHKRPEMTVDALRDWLQQRATEKR